MKKLNLLFLILLNGHLFGQNLLLWDGEISTIISCQFEYGTLDSLNAHNGMYSFNAIPDPWHSPGIHLSCQNTWRSDISMYDELWFHVKANQVGNSFRFYTSGWPHFSNRLDVLPYIQGGIVDTTYRLVRIPIDSLQTDQFLLENVEYVYFDTSTVAGFQLFVDDIVAMDLSPIHADSTCYLSNQAIKISVSDKYDTTAVQSTLNYFITSLDDTDFATNQNPSKVGMHYYVYDFSESGPFPKSRNEIFLFFDQKMKNGKTYKLSIINIKDRANNDFDTIQDFVFTYNDEKEITNSVKVNQVGYLPVSPKFGYIGNYLGGAGPMECNPSTFEIRKAGTAQTIFTGVPYFKAYDPLSGEKVYECNFSAFNIPGKYYMYVPEIGRSYNFKIDSTVFDSVYYTTSHALYYQRCGIALEEPYAAAGFTHAVCHLSDGIVHSSCGASGIYNNEIVGSEVVMPGGWHDAGDYGRYIHSATTALYDIFSMYELYPQKYTRDNLNIPESGNGVPDILDEAKWEIDWYKEMQAPDGGVYFKVNPTEWPSTLPEFNNDTLFLAQKTTFSTGMYAAVMAMAYRNFQPYWPEYADTCLARSIRSMNFLLAHPGEDPMGGFLTNPLGIGGGEGGDPDGDSDERAWAAAELYKATGNPFYDSIFAIYWSVNPAYWGWNSFQHHQKNASFAYATTTFPTDSNKINAYLDGLWVTVDYSLIPQHDGNVYQNAFRSDVLGWIGWGAFAQSTRYSLDFIKAYYFSGDQKYINYAKINLDTQLGSNPQNMCYITGVGSKSPMDPLHNQSRFDTIVAPIPGLSLYGPNSHLSFANGYDAITQGSANLYPLGEQEVDPYPILRRFYDNRENVAMNEFDIDNLGYTAMVYGFFASTPAEEDLTAVLTKPTLSQPSGFNLMNYPNPFGDKTSFCFVLNKSEKVTLQVYDVNQKQVALLIDQTVSAGRNSISYDTSLLVPGIYFCEVKTGSGKQVIKIVKY